MLLLLACSVSGAFLPTSFGSRWPAVRRLKSLIDADSAPPPTVEVVAPGLVLVHGAVSIEDQRLLADEAQMLGARPDLGLLGGGDGRSRMYDQVNTLPAIFASQCAKAVRLARGADAHMPTCSATHCLTNEYRTRAGLRWHRGQCP